MNYTENYRLWLEKVTDNGLKDELLSIENDDEKIMERFSEELKFGTAGLRGIIAAGSGCMNIYTVRRATQGLVDYINERYGGGCVAIAYDSRRKSAEFAKEAASVLAANGVEVHIFSELEPTPMLSFAVRDLRAKAGIMVTASHNPAAYNGYKVYGSDGCQMTTEDADAVYSRIERVDLFGGVKTEDFEKALADGRIKYIGKQLIRRYYDAVSAERIIEDSCLKYPLKIVYTPLNGAGNIPVREMLREMGAGEVITVPEQELPDENFTTCPYPNPEMREALSLGLKLCETEKPDLLIATDPDCDRVGVAVRDKGEYTILTGNEVGVLLLNYIAAARAEKKKTPENPVAVRSVVSTALADDIAKRAGIDMRIVLTGFKFIGEQILLLEQQGRADSFVFGFEESCGYLAGSYVRDKDAVLASVLICEMTSYYKLKNKTLLAVLDELYDEFGFYRHRVLNIAFGGADASRRMTEKMDSIRADFPRKAGGLAIRKFLDFESGEEKDLATGETAPIGLPKSDIVELVLENEAKLMIRPSGTEPKIKVYLTAKERSADASAAMLDLLEAFSKELLGV